MACLVIKYHLLALFLDKGQPVRKGSGINFWEANFIFWDILVLLNFLINVLFIGNFLDTDFCHVVVLESEH